MTIGNKISECRKQRGMTQDALAQLLGVTNQAVSKWESDQSCPDVMLLPKIADIFDLSIDALFDRAPKEEPKEPQNQRVSGLPWPDDKTLRVVVYVGHTLVGSSVSRSGLSLRYEGPVRNVESCISVSCGDVAGDVSAGGSVACGSVGGNVDAGKDVACEGVGGDVDAGNDVACGDVSGDVDAGGKVTCGDVGGDVDAGGSVECKDVSGDVDAGGSVRIDK